MIAAILLSLVAVTISAAAVLFGVWSGDRIKPASDLIASAAAGILLVAAALHLAPEAAALNRHAVLFIAAGMAASWLAARSSAKAGHSGDLILLGGVALHSFADGLVLTVAGAAGFGFLLSSGAGLLMHEIPEGLLCYLLARRAGLATRTAAATAIIAGGGTTFVGAVLSVPLIAGVGAQGVGALLGISTGLLANSAMSIVFARPREQPARRGAVACAAGLSMAILILVLPSHNHAAHGALHAHHPTADRPYSPCLYAPAPEEAGCPVFSSYRPYRPAADGD